MAALSVSVSRQICAPVSRILVPLTPRRNLAKNLAGPVYYSPEKANFLVAKQAEAIHSPQRSKLGGAGCRKNAIFSPKSPSTPGRSLQCEAVTSALAVYMLTTKIRSVEETVRSEFQKALQRLPSTLSANWRNVHGSNNWAGMLDPMDHDLRTEVIRYGEFAQVCYDAFDNDRYSRYFGSCKYTRNHLLQKSGLPNTGYEVTKYIYATAEGSVLNLFKKPDAEDPWSSDSNWMGFVAVTTSDKEIKRLGRRDIVISWRGTVLPQEWIQNLKDFLEPARFEPSDEPSSGVKVESGFLNMYTSSNSRSRYNKSSAREQLLAEIRRLVEKYKGEELSITFTGHSLGGALALLSAYDVAELGINFSNDGKKIPIAAITFGAPRLGNDAFRDRCNDLAVKVMRVVNEKDMVPKVPGIIFNEGFHFLRHMLEGLPWTYSHVGTELRLNSENSHFLRRTADPACHHNLEAYLHLLDGYHGPGSVFCSSTNRDPALVNKASDFLKKELGVPANWWQDHNRGLVQDCYGRWVQPKREVEDTLSDFGLERWQQADLIHPTTLCHVSAMA